jgi:hypothetical protein
MPSPAFAASSEQVLYSFCSLSGLSDGEQPTCRHDFGQAREPVQHNEQRRFIRSRYVSTRPGAPTGTYSLKIIGTSGGLKDSTSVKLVIQ